MAEVSPPIPNKTQRFGKTGRSARSAAGSQTTFLGIRVPMFVNPYQPPPLKAEAESEAGRCGCPRCGYRFGFADAITGWTPRMACKHCSARLIGNWFIYLHPLFLAAFAISANLCFLATLGKWLFVLAAASLFSTLITLAYLWGTLRWGRFRVDDSYHY